jgi:nucleoid-associated protein YgaU
MDIFKANRDQLSDPNAIRPGQVLKIPVPVRR